MKYGGAWFGGYLRRSSSRERPAEPFNQAGHDEDKGCQDGDSDDQEAPPCDAADGGVVGHLLFRFRLLYDGRHEREAQEEIADGGGNQRARQNPGRVCQQFLISPFLAVGGHRLFYPAHVE